MARVGIYGATGYTGFELIKILRQHPQVEIAFATARADAGKRLSDIYPTVIDQPLIAMEDVNLHNVDLVFTCLPHGAAELPRIVRDALDANIKVVDFSDTFRLSSALEYERRREKVHPAPDLLEHAVYGLPELHRDRISTARLVANTGCYPLTAILPLYALNRAGLVVDGTAIVDSKSGVTGAGRALSLGTHFSETHENFSAYKIGRVHRHLGEMEQETGLQIIFSPHLLPVLRGILSTIYVNLRPGTTPEIVHLALGIYQDEPMIQVLPNGRLPELRHVVHTNMLAIGYQAVDVMSGRYILVAVLDNLLKGASGQAVQNMNLMLGFEETTALI